MDAAAESLATALHPYYPLGLSIPLYLANTYNVPTLLALFGGGCFVILASACLVALRYNPALPRTELGILMWFVLCGFIHFFFEGYFALFHASIASHSSLFGQLWKEYALSDSRYLTSDPFVLCMETITAVFWGPLSFAVAFAIPARHPLRHPLQLIVSLGQLYGDILYYATCWFNEHYFGLTYGRPEAYYFWGYYVLMNAFWIVIPLTLMWSSVSEITKAIEFARGRLAPAAKARSRVKSPVAKNKSSGVASVPGASVVVAVPSIAEPASEKKKRR